MKNLLKIITFFIICYTQSYGQITLNNTIFPAVDDVYEYSIDENPDSSITITVASPEKQIWDFTSLINESEREERYQDKIMGNLSDSFPNAQLLSINEEGIEEYLAVSDDDVSILGYSLDLLGFSFPISYQSPLLVLKSPTVFGDNFTNSYETNFAIAISDYPILDSLLTDLIDLQGAIDSLRIRTSIAYEVDVDAWGECNIPLGTFEVLRMKETVTTNTVIEALIGFGPISTWLDVGAFLEDLELPTSEIAVNYKFQSLDHKELIANISLRPDETINRVLFKRGVATSTRELNQTEKATTIFPNPSHGVIQFNLATQQMLHLNFHTLQGQLIHQINIESSLKNHSINLQDLPKSTYFYTLTSLDGSIIESGKIVLQ